MSRLRADSDPYENMMLPGKTPPRITVFENKPASSSLRSRDSTPVAGSRRGSVSGRDLGSQCIALDATGAGDSWIRCPNQATEGPVLTNGLKFKRYCDRHWNILLESTGNVGVYTLKPNGEPNEVDICIDPDAKSFDDNLFVNCKDRKQKFELFEVFNADEVTDDLIDRKAPSPKRQTGISKPGSPIAAETGRQGIIDGVLQGTGVGRIQTQTVQDQPKRVISSVKGGLFKDPLPIYGQFDKSYPWRGSYETKLEGDKVRRTDALVQKPYMTPVKTADPRKRKFRNHLYEKNTAPPFIDFSSDKLVDSLEVIDTTKDYKEALEHIYYLKMIIDKSTLNKEYNYEITEDVADQVAEMLGAYMYDMDRIELVLAYLFDFDSRDLTVDFRYFGFKPTSKATKNKLNKEGTDSLKQLARPIQTGGPVRVKSIDIDTGFPANTDKIDEKLIKPLDINEEKEYLMKKYETNNQYANMQDLIKMNEPKCSDEIVKNELKCILRDKGVRDVDKVLKELEDQATKDKVCIVNEYRKIVKEYKVESTTDDSGKGGKGKKGADTPPAGGQDSSQKPPQQPAGTASPGRTPVVIPVPNVKATNTPENNAKVSKIQDKLNTNWNSLSRDVQLKLSQLLQNSNIGFAKDTSLGNTLLNKELKNLIVNNDKLEEKAPSTSPVRGATIQPLPLPLGTAINGLAAAAAARSQNSTPVRTG